MPETPMTVSSGIAGAPNLPLREDVYGHVKRLRWIISQLQPSDVVVEFGCGTGYMITYQLVRLGYNAFGIDVDQASIAYGQDVLAREGLDPRRLWCGDAVRFEKQADVIIASEVLEHIPRTQLPGTFSTLKSKLRPAGRLLVTVPNGYGWFEFESFLWSRVGIGRLIENLGINRAIRRLRSSYFDYTHPAFLAGSPHVNRFTLAGIRRLLADNGFIVEYAKGSVLFAGPFSNLLFTGLDSAMRINAFAGDHLPWAAAGFFIACRAEM